jgi:hypothetical protein
MLKMGVPDNNTLIGDFPFSKHGFKILTLKNSPGGFAGKTSILMRVTLYERTPMLDTPTFLFGLVFETFASAIPIIYLLVIIAVVAKVAKWTYRSIRN